MEYVDGQSLYAVRRNRPGPWPLETCLNVVSQVAEALGAAHTLGIVHRDIKPSNILLLVNSNGHGQVKVLDFGISKVNQGSFAGMTSVLTQQSLIIGTPEYMSPEQASGRAESAIDGRADLYSLGLVLYEMLTGAHPFQADTPMGMLIQQLNTQPPPPESISTVPPTISALVLKCLQKDPKDRFQSAAQMLTALKDSQSWYAPPASAIPSVSNPPSPLAHQEPSIPPVPSSPPAPSERRPEPEQPRPPPRDDLSATTLRPPPSPLPFKSRSLVITAGIALPLLAGLIWLGLAMGYKKTPSPPIAASLSPVVNPEVLKGEGIFLQKGCSVCHTGDASARGPNLAGAFGSRLQLAIGTLVTVDDAFLRAAIMNPSQHLPTGYAPTMPTYQGQITEEDLTALIAYLKSDFYRSHPPVAQALAPAATNVPAPATPVAKTPSATTHSAATPPGVSPQKPVVPSQTPPQSTASQPAKAAPLIGKACDDGWASSCLKLAQLYEDGTGVSRDPGEASILYQKACTLGDKGSFEKAKEISPIVPTRTPSQLQTPQQGPASSPQQPTRIPKDIKMVREDPTHPTTVSGVAGMSEMGNAPMGGTGRVPIVAGRARVGAGVMSGAKISGANPVYPPVAKAAHISRSSSAACHHLEGRHDQGS